MRSKTLQFQRKQEERWGRGGSFVPSVQATEWYLECVLLNHDGLKFGHDKKVKARTNHPISHRISAPLGGEVLRAESCRLSNAITTSCVRYTFPIHETRALQQFEMALACARRLREARFESGWLGYIGNVHRHAGRLYVAKTTLRQAIIIAKTLGDTRYHGHWLVRLGSVERAAGEHQAAAKSLTEAEALLRQADAKDPLAECLCEQGLLTIGLEGHAEKLLAEALEIAKELEVGAQTDLASALRTLSQELAKKR